MTFNIGTRNRCVLAYTFDQGQGEVVLDESGYGNHGAVKPDVVFWTIGNNVIGDSDQYCFADIKYAGILVGAVTGRLQKLTAYIKRSSVGEMKLALYLGTSSTAPSTLIVESLPVTVGTTYSWVDFPIAESNQPLINTASNTYFIAALTDAVYTLKYQSGSQNIITKDDTYSNGFATPFGSLPTVLASRYPCFYASGVSSPPYWYTGKYGSALTYDGVSGYVSAPDSESLRVTGDLTLMCWVWLNTMTATQALIAKSQNYEFEWDIAANGQMEFCHTGTAKQSDVAAMSVNQWTHLAVVRDMAALTITFYVNGTQFGATQSFTTSPTAGTDPVTFGMYGGVIPLYGSIDEAYIFKRALTAAEISYIYAPKSFGSTTRQVDRSKIRSKIIIKGTDATGAQIIGSAGIGFDVQIFVSTDMTESTTSLNALAATLLSEMSQQGVGTPLPLPISIGAYLKPGDTFPINLPLFALTGAPRIQKITKNTSSVTICLERSRGTLEMLLGTLKNAVV